MNQVSIKRDIYIYLFGVVFSLIAIYSLMVNQSYVTGTDESVKYGFLYEIGVVEQAYLESGEVPKLTDSKTLQVYTDLAQVPEKFVTYFAWDTFQEDVIYQAYAEAQPSQPAQYLYATYHIIEGSDVVLYMVSQYDEALYFKMLEDNPPESMQHSNLAMGGILLFIVFLIIRLLIHRIVSPLLALSQWAETLDVSNTGPIKNLRYKELAILSQSLVASVEKQKQVIEREAFFLRAASHELRTPIAIISASSDMLTRVQEELPKSSQRAIGRIGRSIATMQRLMTTLLWLARDQDQSVETVAINLNVLVNSVVEDNTYLIKEKGLSIQVECDKNEVILHGQVEALVSIVLMNLIRNAIQHSENGEVRIVVNPNGVEVINFIASADEEPVEGDLYSTSFGVGLFLVEKICHKQGWQFSHRKERGCFIALVELIA